MRRVPWIALTLGGMTLLGWLALRGQSLGLFRLPPCPFKQLTGWACASCGLTRCLTALGDGRLGEAWHWHPLGTLAVLSLPLWALWDLRRAWQGAAYPALPDSDWARWGALAALAGTWCLQLARGI